METPLPAADPGPVSQLTSLAKIVNQTYGKNVFMIPPGWPLVSWYLQPSFESGYYVNHQLLKLKQGGVQGGHKLQRN